jgi:transporter family-2 protein
MSIIIQIVMALLGGVAAGLQAPFAGIMGQKVGDLGSVFFTYCGGAVLVALFVFVGTGGNALANWRDIPWYAFLAGPLGLVIIGTISYSVPRLGAAVATLLFVVAWLILSGVIDHFGWFGLVIRPLTTTRMLGMLILILGTWLVIR